MAIKDKPDAVDNTNQTMFGSNRQGRSCVAVNASPGMTSAIFLVDANGVEWAFWTNTSGQMQRGTRANWIANSGTPV